MKKSVGRRTWRHIFLESLRQFSLDGSHLNTPYGFWSPQSRWDSESFLVLIQIVSVRVFGFISKHYWSSWNVRKDNWPLNKENLCCHQTISSLPFYVSVFLNLLSSKYSLEYIAKAAQIFRILRILRIFKLSRHK